MTTWQIDPTHTSVEFGVKHLMISTVRGSFKDVSGTVTPGERPSVEVSIPVATIDTGVGQRDDHLRSADFFDTANHPAMTFVGTLVEGDIQKGGTLAGDLTIRGVSKPVALAVEANGEMKDAWGNTKVGFTATGTINRTEFGLTWNQLLETGGIAVGEKVKLTIDVQVVKPAEVAA
jgi:polyisoprenoid-binding protein YceI